MEGVSLEYDMVGDTGLLTANLSMNKSTVVPVERSVSCST